MLGRHRLLHDRDGPARHLRAAASSQYEKVETTFFSLSFPDNSTLQAPIVEPLEDTLTEAEIHSRFARELGLIDDGRWHRCVRCRGSREAFAAAFMEAAMGNPTLGAIGAVVLYETLGRTLPRAWRPRQRCGSAPSRRR